jgi:hypothetical protein
MPYEKSYAEVLKSKGFVIGGHVTEFKSKSEAAHFTITEVGEKCTLQEIIRFSDVEPRICKVEWLKLMKFWKVSTVCIKQLMLKDHIHKHPTEMPIRFVHLELMTIYEELLKLSEARNNVDVMKHALFTQNPDTLRWGCDVKAGQLMLTPAVPRENIKWYKVGAEGPKTSSV